MKALFKSGSHADEKGKERYIEKNYAERSVGIG